MQLRARDHPTADGIEKLIETAKAGASVTITV
jgi:hypothetical protein